MKTHPTPEIPPRVVAVEVSFQVEICSDGSKEAHYDAGVWFQASPLIHNFNDFDAAKTAMRDYGLKGAYRWLPLRIVQTTSVSTVVDEMGAL